MNKSLHLKNSRRSNVILTGGKAILLSVSILTLHNCSNYSPEFVNARTMSLSKYSVSTSKRTLIKTGSLNFKTSNVREASISVENIVDQAGGYMTSMSERDDKTKNANFEIRVPAQNLVSAMDRISELGKVTYRKVSVEDVTAEMIKQKALLNKLRTRRDRLKSLYRSAKKLSDKLTLEKNIAEVEEKIFSMEEEMKQMRKVARFSKLSVSVSQARIRGPLGVVKDSATWSFKKLFTIRE